MKAILLFVLIALVFTQVVDPELNGAFKGKKNVQIVVTLKEQIELDTLIYRGKNFYQYNADERAEIILKKFTEFSEFTQKDIISELKEGNYDYYILWIINGVIIRNADERLVQKLSLKKNIRQISLDKEYKIDEIEERSKQYVPNVSSQNATIEFNVRWVNAHKVWEMGYDGSGIVVGVGDTGLNHRHESLINAYRGTRNNNGTYSFDHNYNWHDPSRSREPQDTNGHGTHCSGTVAGGKGISRKIGVAPGAKIIHCRALVTIAAQIECMQWWIAPTDLNNQNPQTNLRPHVVSHSYNNWACSPRCDPDYKRATEAVIAAGIQVVNSAGNRGAACGSINPNSRFPVQLSIASIKKESDDISSFSSRGPNPLNQTLLKPDLSAPGEQVVSAVARTNNTYVAMSGTSMSTPNVAGGVALLWSAVPKLVRDVKKTNEILAKSSKHQESSVCAPRGTPNGVYGHGTVDYEKAVKLAKQIYNMN